MIKNIIAVLHFMNADSPDIPIIIFDGHCNLCSNLMKFIKKQDIKTRFDYVPLQALKGKELMLKYEVDQSNSNSVILIDREGIALRSQAVFKIAQRLGGWWNVLCVFKIFPRKVNDYFYEIIARNRFRLAGRREECTLWEE